MDLSTLSDDELRTHTPVSGGAPDYWIAHMKEVTRRFLKGAHSVTGSYRDGYEAGFDDAEDGFPNRFR